MIKSEFNLQTDWNKIEKLCQEIQGVISIRRSYLTLKEKEDEMRDSNGGYILDHGWLKYDTADSDEYFANKINELIIDYVNQ